MLYTAGLFGLVALILIAQLFWHCEPESQNNGWRNKTDRWKSMANPQCNLGKEVAISQLVCALVL
jgi:hypothetical protein